MVACTVQSWQSGRTHRLCLTRDEHISPVSEICTFGQWVQNYYWYLHFFRQLQQSRIEWIIDRRTIITTHTLYNHCVHMLTTNHESKTAKFFSRGQTHKIALLTDMQKTYQKHGTTTTLVQWQDSKYSTCNLFVYTYVWVCVRFYLWPDVPYTCTCIL